MRKGGSSKMLVAEALDISRRQPEKRLLAAVLRQTMVDLFSGHKDKIPPAIAWVEDDSKTEQDFLSFKSVCFWLGLDYYRWREQLRRISDGELGDGYKCNPGCGVRGIRLW